jgi:hypothetical protein
MIQFVVIEGRHKDPNDFSTLEIESKIIHGPFNNEEDAKKTVKQLKLLELHYTMLQELLLWVQLPKLEIKRHHH